MAQRTTLNQREERFCLAYIANGGNARAAALEAGYKPGTAKKASEWVRPDKPEKPNLLARIEALTAEKQTSLVASAEETLQRLTAFLRREKDEAGERPAVAEAIRAGEILAKYHGLLRDRVEIYTPDKDALETLERDVRRTRDGAQA